MSQKMTHSTEADMVELAGLDESFREETITLETQLHQCEICDFKSKYKSNLKRHRKVHYDDTTDTPICYMCDVCGKQLKTKYGLKQHTDSKHKLLFRFTCGSCKRGFNSLYNYRGHLASHDKVLKEKCSQCQATFQYKSCLQDHVRSHHNGCDYKCTAKDCQKTFNSTRALREHTLVIHQNKRYNCAKCNKTFKWRSSAAFHEKNAHTN